MALLDLVNSLKNRASTNKNITKEFESQNMIISNPSRMLYKGLLENKIQAPFQAKNISIQTSNIASYLSEKNINRNKFKENPQINGCEGELSNYVDENIHPLNGVKGNSISLNNFFNSTSRKSMYKIKCISKKAITSCSTPKVQVSSFVKTSNINFCNRKGSISPWSAD